MSRPRVTTRNRGTDRDGEPILTARVVYPGGGITVYGPMRSRAYSLLYARAARLRHRETAESVASELQRCSEAGAFERRVVRPNRTAAEIHQDALRSDPGDLSGWAETLGRERLKR